MSANEHVVVSLADAFGKIAQHLGRNVRAEMNKTKKDMYRDMALQVELFLEKEVFGKQKSPSGQQWSTISPVTLWIRRKIQKPPFLSRRLGVGPKNAMMDSFKLKKRGNYFKITKTGFIFGSKLKKKGHSVAKSFESTYLVKVFGRGIGKHPGRRIVGTNPKLTKAIYDVGLSYFAQAVERASYSTSVAAGAERAALRDRKPGRAGGVQFF